MKNILLTVLFAGMTLSSVAGTLADIEVQAELPEGNLVQPSQVARLVVTIINNGPDAAVGVGAGTGFFVTPGFRTVEVFPTIETPPCRLNFTDLIPPPPAPAFFGVSIIPVSGQDTVLMSGESVSCTMGLISFPDSPAVVEQAFSAGSPEADPNPDNNQVFLTVLTTAPPIPSAGATALGLLVALTMLSAARALRRRET